MTGVARCLLVCGLALCLSGCMGLAPYADPRTNYRTTGSQQLQCDELVVNVNLPEGYNGPAPTIALFGQGAYAENSTYRLDTQADAAYDLASQWDSAQAQQTRTGQQTVGRPGKRHRHRHQTSTPTTDDGGLPPSAAVTGRDSRRPRPSRRPPRSRPCPRSSRPGRDAPVRMPCPIHCLKSCATKPEPDERQPGRRGQAVRSHGLDGRRALRPLGARLRRPVPAQVRLAGGGGDRGRPRDFGDDSVPGARVTRRAAVARARRARPRPATVCAVCDCACPPGWPAIRFHEGRHRIAVCCRDCLQTWLAEHPAQPRGPT